jgi:hypothetical protein
MASIMRAILLLALLVLPLAHADVGPSPSPPKVTVHLVTNGQPETRVSAIMYHCMGTDTTDPASPVEPHVVEMVCTSGTCTNDEWYYKFSPCFTFPEGYFSYDYLGSEVRTESVGSNKSYEKYDITIDAPTGQVSGNVVSSCNLAGIILPAIMGAALLMARR